MNVACPNCNRKCSPFEQNELHFPSDFHGATQQEDTQPVNVRMIWLHQLNRDVKCENTAVKGCHRNMLYECSSIYKIHFPLQQQSLDNRY